MPSQGDENEASVCNDLCMSRERRPQRQTGGEIKSFLCSFRRSTAASHARLLNVGSVFERKIKKREREASESGVKRDKWLDVEAVNESILMQRAVCGCP